MKFKTKPGKKNRSKYLPRKEGKKIRSKYSPKQQKAPRARKKPMTIRGYQAKEKRFDKLQGKRASTLIQAAKLYGQKEKLSREMEAWRNWRIPEIQRQLEALENKDRSRRRGANKNKWNETDIRKYGKLQAELNQLKGINISDDWKKEVDVENEIGNRKYTEGQKNFVRALKVIEAKISKSAEQIKAIYGSDDIEELANQYYVKELGAYSQEELNQIEEEFNKTHGYHIRIKQGSNPFADIDFENLIPN